MTQRPNASGVRRLAIVGGGTGGHVYPGVAVAEAWLSEVSGSDVVFVGSATGMEARITAELGYAFEGIAARRLKNAGVVERIRSLISMPVAIWNGLQLVRRLKPDVVLGVGGYVSGPVVLAAALGGWPCAIAEQNARPGLTHTRHCTSHLYRLSRGQRATARSKIRQLGNPVRMAFTQSHGERSHTMNIVVLGEVRGPNAQ